MKEIGLIVLGWLLGLLGPTVVDEIRERKTFRSMQRALAVELDELRLILVFVLWKVEAHRLTLDKAFVDWYCEHVERYAGNKVVEEQRQMVLKLKGIPEDALTKIVSSKKEAGVVPGFRTYPTVVLERAIESLDRFGSNDQRYLLEINTQLKLYDSLVQDVVVFFRMTFDDKLSSDNRSKIVANQEDAITRIAVSCRKIVDRIDEISFVST